MTVDIAIRVKENGEEFATLLTNQFSIASAIGLMLRSLSDQVPRYDELLADVIDLVHDPLVEIYRGHRFFEGHDKAVGKLLEAAEELRDGWQEFDEKLDQEAQHHDF